MKAIGKFFKFIFWTVIVLVLLAVVAVLTIPWWIGPTVTGTANFVVPKIVKTDFTLNKFAFNQYKGTFGMGEMKLANPEGFAPENCLELDDLSVKFDPVSCFTKKIHIEKISLDGLRVVADFPQAANFQKIAENVQGEKKEEKAEEPKTEEEKQEEEKEATKVVIDVVEVKNLKVTYGSAPIVLPDFTITGIGKDDGGVTFEEAWKSIYKQVCDKAGIVVGAVLDAGKAAVDIGVQTAGQVMDVGTNAANAAMEAVGNLDAQGAVDAVKDGANTAANLVSEGASSAVNAVSDGAGAAANAVSGLVGGAKGLVGGAAGAAGDGAGSAAGAVGDTAGAAVDAVGKGLNAVGDGAGAAAGAAVDAVKGFFK